MSQLPQTSSPRSVEDQNVNAVMAQQHAVPPVEPAKSAFVAPTVKPIPIGLHSGPAPVTPEVALRPSGTRRWALWAALGLTGCLGAAATGVYGTYAMWRNGGHIVPNIFIAGEPVGDLTREAAQERLQKRYGDLRLTVNTPTREFKLSLREIGGMVDINRAVNDAYWYGRSGSIVQNVPRVLRARYDEQQLRLPVRWNKERLKNRMRAVAKDFNQPAKNASLVVGGNGARIIPEEAGRELNVGETLARLQNRYQVGLASIDATVRDVKPNLTAADLEGSDVKINNYTTAFNRGLIGRTRNIRVASEAINGRVLLPGEMFSFNEATGERTWAKGYRMAHIFERKPGKTESEVVDGLAGGVCQVSSTLYNAVRKSNQKMDAKLKIVQRESHSLPVTYVPRGYDATVAWPYKDFKFRNTLPHPVYLRSAVEGSRLTISVWARVPHGAAMRLAKVED